jgi:hypothetical protein
MNSSLRSLSVAAFLASGACAVAEEDLPELEDEAAATSTLCGEYGTQVASIKTPTGSTADFCDFAGEDLCADEIYARLAPGQRVPQALIDVCAESTSTPLLLSNDAESDGFGIDRDIGAPPVDYSHFCGGGGNAEFDEEMCDWMWNSATASDPYDMAYWCITSGWTSIQKTGTSQMGQKGDKLRVVLASCSGSSEAKLKAKVGGDWDTYIHDTVSSNYWASWSLVTAGLYDLDMRFTAGSDDGYFLTTGYFRDLVWP